MRSDWGDNRGDRWRHENEKKVAFEHERQINRGPSLLGL